ncbi:epidermal growth factor receptor substrate 15-like 1 isoform X3 [Seriola lalandi dorsalis]|uniref:epidermal growth factor receptor substrate 15-like 1 isoform X3 n=1 Tax=Seriola lalandi dorsalis TaxID=1841481 RepID=UPI000C6FC67D|nr:epidermal growth factor receptor substrate 15-like 1 isoform X3 [Seriola lalandi dorsalis]
MAALMTLSQLSSGYPAYETYYRQLDPGNTGKISAGDAAQFLKKSGLSDGTLGKIWDLADSERKGYLDKRGFFIAMRLVASAQGGNDISLNNLNQNLAAPKFKDTNSPLLSVSTAGPDSQWAIRPDEKGKFEGIFESLSPVKGLLPGDKVRPVLINSKLPLDVLGKIWDLSDVDKDGHLDKDEFTVAMHLVYRAMEKEPIPASLPASLIPPSKRKKSAGALPGAVAVLPALSGFMAGPAPLKDTLRSTPPLVSATPLSTSTVNLSPKHSFKSSSPPAVNWVVPVADRERYNDIFKQTDSDNDGLVTGSEVIEIFMQSSLSQTMLAQIWGLADTKQTGKLTREQFSLAMYLIQQKVIKGVDPPSTLTPDMIPPSERTATSVAGPSYVGLLSSLRPEPAVLANMRRDSTGSTGSAELTGIKELDDLSQEIAQLQREKFILEQEIREKEDGIRQQNTEVQDMQNDLDRESSSLQDLESQKQDAQERLEEMDQQRSKLEGMLNDVKQKCQDESQMISSLQSQIRSQETDLLSQEDELSRTKADLSRLQEEEAQLEQSLLSGRVQLDSIVKSLKTTQEEINQARSKLSLIQDSQQELTKTIEQYNSALSDINGGNFSNMPDLSEGFAEKQNGGFRSADDSFKSKIAMFNNSSAKEPPPDPFQTEDPFKSDPFKDPFGGDPFKESDPFKGTSSDDFFKRTDKSDMFGSSDPFGRKPTLPAKPSAFSSGDPFKSNSPKPKDSDVFGTADPFGCNSFGSKGGGFADFSQMSKKSDNPVLPSKKNVPNRPAPPYGSEHVKVRLYKGVVVNPLHVKNLSARHNLSMVIHEHDYFQCISSVALIQVPNIYTTYVSSNLWHQCSPVYCGGIFCFLKLLVLLSWLFFCVTSK